MKTKVANPRRLNITGNVDCSPDRDILTATVKQWRQKLGYCSIFAAIPAILATQVSEARSDEVKRTEASAVGYRGRGARLVERLNMSCSNPALLKRQSEYRLPHQKGNFDTLAALAGIDDCPGRAIPGGTYTAAAPYIDSGDTTGANDTVTHSNYYYSYDAFGPDHVYSFTLTGRGPNPQIQVSTTSGTYRPLIYVLQGGSAGACPAGTGNTGLYTLVLTDSRWTPGSNSATLNIGQMNFLPLNVPLHLFVDSARNDAGGSGPYTIRIQDVTISLPACSNPIDCPEFFVRQHYLDFLNREPDPAGQGFWTSNITKCSDPSQRPAARTESECVDNQKVNTSAAFFLSPEFQYTGYFVYRLYKGSLIKDGAGRVPTYQEFRNDIWRVSQNIIQNNQLSAAKIEENKKRLTEAGAIFRRDEETFDHLGIIEVAIEVQLIEPVLITRYVRVAMQIAKVLHQHEGRVELFLVKRLTVRGRKLLVAL